MCAKSVGKLQKINFPPDVSWRLWIERWDRMQDYYISHRKERFELMVRLIADTQQNVQRILDVGCGTGSLMLAALQRFLEAKVIGIDFDPTLLALAEKRLHKFGQRVQLIQTDIRDESWLKSVPAPVDAAVSATALHWLSARQLSRFYGQLAQILRSGGIFLNADHVGSSCPSIQAGWEKHREQKSKQKKYRDADDWEGFWDAYGQALKLDIKEIRKKLEQPWQGSEEGLPLQRHFEKLKASGFEAADCFWRCDCDAIYGGIRH